MQADGGGGAHPMHKINIGVGRGDIKMILVLSPSLTPPSFLGPKLIEGIGAVGGVRAPLRPRLDYLALGPQNPCRGALTPPKWGLSLAERPHNTAD